MKTLKTILISASTVVITFLLLIKFFGNPPGEDLNGFTPKTLLDHHLKLCKEGKIDEALTLWTPESLERNAELREYCENLGTITLEYSRPGKGKKDTILFIVAGVANDERSRRIFYFELRDSNWHLHYPPLIR